MTTTYKYISAIECSIDNPVWEDEEGDLSLIAGKVPEVYMPNVLNDETEQVEAYRYERKTLVELPERMPAEDAFEWVREQKPAGVGDFYDQKEKVEGEQ